MASREKIVEISKFLCTFFQHDISVCAAIMNAEGRLIVDKRAPTKELIKYLRIVKAYIDEQIYILKQHNKTTSEHHDYRR